MFKNLKIKKKNSLQIVKNYEPEIREYTSDIDSFLKLEKTEPKDDIIMADSVDSMYTIEDKLGNIGKFIQEIYVESNLCRKIEAEIEEKYDRIRKLEAEIDEIKKDDEMVRIARKNIIYNIDIIKKEEC